MNKYYERKSKNLCTRCGKDELATTILCFSCQTWMNNKAKSRRIKAKENGICGMCCARPSIDGLRHCTKCQAIQKRKSKRYLKEGKCNCCGGRGVLKNSRWLCEVCWFKLSSYNNLGTRNRWEEIRDLFYNQNAICSVTGKQLVLGKNASIDHIMPKSRNGSNELDNLQWITTKANHFKNDKTMEEMIELCKLILSRHNK